MEYPSLAFKTKPQLLSRWAIYISLACLIIFSIASNLANAEDWKTYRYDSARSGVTTEKMTTPLSLQWTFKPNHSPEPAWPPPAEELPRMHFDSAYHVSVVDGTVYFGSSVDNKVYAIDSEKGEVRWTFFTEGPVRFAPSIWKDQVYVGSDDGYVYCLKSKDGKLVWKYRAGPSDEKVLGNGRRISLWPVRTSVLVDQSATDDSVLEAFDWLVDQATHKDMVLLFISGHGVKDKRGNPGVHRSSLLFSARLFWN